MKNKFNQPLKFKPKPQLVDISKSELTQQTNTRLLQGLALHTDGKFESARLVYKEILNSHPKHFDALQLLGALAVQTKKWDMALKILTEAIEINNTNPSVYNNCGVVFKELVRMDEALQSFNKAIELKPDYAEVYSNRGLVLQEIKRFDEALLSFNIAINLKCDYVDAYYNRANVLKELKRPFEALEDYEKAIALKPDFAEAYSNRGLTLQGIKRLEAALLSHDKAIELKNEYKPAYNNRGLVLQELNRLDEALLSYNKAIEFENEDAEIYSNRGNVLRSLNRLDEALESYSHVMQLRSNYEYMFGTLMHTKMNMCNWQDFKINIERLQLGVEEIEKISQSFLLLGLTDNLSILRKSAEIWIKDKYPLNLVLGPLVKSKRNCKVKIGYYSADFRDHAVSILCAELFELHDRSKYELIGFYFGPLNSSDMHKRVLAAFDRFIDIRLNSDKEIAQLSRDLSIDIAVDLTGMTENERPGIFSYRAAPIQLSYIGYLGTMGAEYYDYLIADKTIIPAESQKYYSEKIVYLPSFQVNDSKREIADRVFTRAELNLPEKGFVFCCFNNNYKITPTVFDGWIKILIAVPHSVLFVYADNKWAESNLKLEAEKRGVNKNRLVFGYRISKSEYLARYRSADLFLDTLPYNAGTTASDALWTGLPVLTLMGESFASRVAASLLNAIELPELITTTQEQYEATAIELATNPVKLNAIKDKLRANRLTTALFDTPRFTKNIEAAFMQMYERYQADLLPEHIYIEYN